MTLGCKDIRKAELVQGYPQRMRIQRRLYRIYTVYFLLFKILCNIKLVAFVAMSIIIV